MNTPVQRLNERISTGQTILIDGGTGSEFKRRGLLPDPSSWWAGWAETQPDTVVAIHEDFIRAGAEVIITSTFCTSEEVLRSAGMEDKVELLNRRAVELAREAVDSAGEGRGIVVAGGVPALAPSFADFYDDFTRQVTPLAEAGADVLLIEMACREIDVRNATSAAVATGLPTWVGMTCQLHNGLSYLGVHSREDHPPTDLTAEAARAAEDLGASVLFAMHTPTHLTPPAIDAMRQASALPVGAYANNPESAYLSPAEYADHAEVWVARGASLVGGCCGTAPTHVQAIKERLAASRT